jgi:hypothetical protein
MATFAAAERGWTRRDIKIHENSARPKPPRRRAMCRFLSIRAPLFQHRKIKIHDAARLKSAVTR